MGFSEGFVGGYSMVAGAKRSKALMSALRSGGKSKPVSDPVYDSTDTTSDQESSLSKYAPKSMDEENE